VNIELANILTPSVFMARSWKDNSLFYQQMGWHLPGTDDPYPNAYTLSSLPKDDDELISSDYDTFTDFVFVYKSALNTVHEFDISVRNRLRSGKETKIFMELSTDASKI
jgi:hypothetical protein